MTHALFASERARFRLWNADDLEAGIALWCNAEVMRFIEPPLEDADAVLACIAAGKAHYDAFGVQHFALEHKSSGEVIGCCGFNRADETSTDLELVIHLRVEWWDRGYGKETVNAALAWVRQHPTLTCKRVLASTATENIAMQRILEGAGMTCLGEQWYDDTEQHELSYEVDITDGNSPL